MVRVRGNRVGTRAERQKWRGYILGGVAALLGMATMSTHPSVMETSSTIKTNMPMGRSLFSTETGVISLEENRGLFELQDCLQGINDVEESICLGEDQERCFIDEDFEFACCLAPLGVNGEDSSVEDEGVICSTKSGFQCPGENLCVAELIPGSAVGAQCLTDFENSAGGAIVYLLLLVYLFLGLAIVCDDYFSYALDMLGDYLGLSSDVKGATFAAIGSSAPELFVSLADNVIANPPKSVGVGTIVGSAIFNILVIIGASAVVAGRTFGDLKLSWRPLLRDSVFYIFSICGLIGVAVTDDEARHFEGAILVLVYFVYLTFMIFNERAFAWLDRTLGLEREQQEALVPASEKKKEEPKDDVEKLDAAEAAAEEGAEGGEKKRRGSTASAIAKGKLQEEEPGSEPYWSPLYWPVYDPNEGENTAGDAAPVDWGTRFCGGGIGMWGRRLYFVIVAPLNFLFRITIPDAQYDVLCEDKDGNTDKRIKAYWFEFAMCIVWIAILSHFLVFSAAKFGCIAGIDPAVMGLTVLAAGTSVPDMITSIILTKNGEGDGAVANSIGSNVFDILIGLGFPWFLAEFVHGEPSPVATGDLGIAIGFLFGVLIILLGALAFTKFHLNTGIGATLLVLYALYVVFELFIRPAVIDDDDEE